MRALQVAVAAVRPAPGREALWKLGARRRRRATSRSTAIVPELAGAAGAARGGGAAGHRRRSTTAASAAALDPYGLLLRDGFWYVVGHDHEHDELRTYRVDRIDGDVDGRRAAARSSGRPGFDLRDGVPERPEAARRRRRRRRRGRRARRRRSRRPASSASSARTRVVARRDDGAIEVEVPCANVPAFRSWVLGLLDHAEVLGPPDVRADVVDWLQQLARPTA